MAAKGQLIGKDQILNPLHVRPLLFPSVVSPGPIFGDASQAPEKLRAMPAVA
jgi:hypothetical protein